ncbi:MAG: hypothetical protein FWF44_00855 [Defluviitaleaceae bacterium]|nr:hypothetical protein [Defluviitaleaceae bacterium]
MTEFLASAGNTLSKLFTNAFNWFVVKQWPYLPPGQLAGMIAPRPHINWAVSLFRIFACIFVPIVGIAVILKLRLRRSRKKTAALAENKPAALSGENEQTPAAPPN